MLSTQAEQVIHDYLNLPFKGLLGVRCPYFNNSRLQQRGQLRSLIGKGSPGEIAEEAKIISLQYHAGLFDKQGACCIHNTHTGAPVTSEDIRRFLIDHNLGIECSGFVTQVLRAHYQETKRIDITKKLKIARRGLLRSLVIKLRPIENIGVTTYASDENTETIKNLQDIRSGDLVIMLDTDPKRERNHIMLVTDARQNTIHYAHARAWSREGQYGHGVARGTIAITRPAEDLLKQDWEELGLKNENNETFLEARRAKTLMVRRLRF